MGQAVLGVALVVATAALSTHVVVASGTNSSASPTSAAVCGGNVPNGHVRCYARAELRSNGVRAYAASPVSGSYGPADLQAAYRIGGGGSGRTVAIVDVQDDPNAEADLGTYRAQYGLPPCTTANGCFRKVNTNGAASGDAGWAQEISLDLDMVSAACPACHILLVEVPVDPTGSASIASIGSGVDLAVQLGAGEVSLSLGSGEFAAQTASDPHFNHPGVTITVASGDSGYATSYPATAPNVVAVGGTSLRRAPNPRGFAETAWTGTGSGCSQFEAKPTWQHDSGCAKRTDNDVSVVADPNTGVAVYDSYGLSTPGWQVYGGTSVGAPLVAAMDAVSGILQGTGAQAAYTTAPTIDVTSGSNGACLITYLCTALPGFDGPTGVGALLATPPSSPVAPPAATPPSSSAPPSSAQGYWLVASDGGIFSFGNAGFHGSTGAMRLNQPIVGMARTGSGGGYWLVASDGGIFAFGDAQFYGSTGAMRLNQPIVGMASTADGGGYWLVASDGGIFSFGNAGFHGSTGAMRLNQPIVGMARTGSGGGYWLVARDGGIFAFGDAQFFGSTGAMQLNQPIVGMAATPDGGGYWLVASDGGIFSFGDARFLGSTGAMRLNQPIAGMATTRDGGGYWLVAHDGGIFTFGDAQFHGSTGGMRLNQPIVAMASASG